MNKNNNRKTICGNCTEFLAINTSGKDGICSRLAKMKCHANRQGDGVACYQFDPITDNLPPVPEGNIDWIPLTWDAPIYGGFILVRWAIIDQHGKSYGIAYVAQKTPFDGEIAEKTRELPDGSFRKHIPTHFAYIGEPKQ